MATASHVLQWSNVNTNTASKAMSYNGSCYHLKCDYHRCTTVVGFVAASDLVWMQPYSSHLCAMLCRFALFFSTVLNTAAKQQQQLLNHNTFAKLTYFHAVLSEICVVYFCLEKHKWTVHYFAHFTDATISVHHCPFFFNMISRLLTVLWHTQSFSNSVLKLVVMCFDRQRKETRDGERKRTWKRQCSGVRHMDSRDTSKHCYFKAMQMVKLFELYI